MRFLHLILRNALRNKRRTALTVLSLGISLFLFVFFDTLFSNWARGSEHVSDADRLLIVRPLSFSNFLPDSHAKLIERVPDVELVHPWHYFDGRLEGHPREVFANFAVEAETFEPAWSDYKVDAPVLDAWLKDRRGAIVGKKLLDRFGWKVGQTVVLVSAIYPTCEPMLVIKGTYEGGRLQDALFFQRRYLQELLKDTPFEGRTWGYRVLVKHPETLPAVIATIDATMQGSSAPTKTETEKDLLIGMVSMVSDVRALVTNVTFVVLGVVFLVVSNTMAMGVRERTREIATMKAIGFTPTHVVSLVIAEGVVTALLGGLLGCVGTRVLFENILGRPTIVLGYFPDFAPTWATVGEGMGLAALIGFLSALVPAVQAARIEVVAGLRRVG
ncbi:MAG: ABC transporter permease [Planctomycetota bacterium]